MLTRRLPRVARRSRPAPLPDGLRQRLLAIPSAGPARRAIVPDGARGVGAFHWLGTTPLLQLAASLAVALALGAAMGNPYQAGAATLDRLQHRAAPATASLTATAAVVAGSAAELGRQVVELLPGAGLRASQSLTVRLADRVFEDAAAAPSTESSDSPSPRRPPDR